MNYIIKNGKLYRKGTLAHFLDKREISIEEPTVACLPETINPYKFIMENVLANNCSVIKLKHSEMKYSSDLLSLLNDLLPAEQALLIYIDVDDLSSKLKVKVKKVAKTYKACACKAAPLEVYTRSVVTCSPLEEACK